MNIEEQGIFREFLVSRLPNGKNASGGKEVNCRCMYHDDHSRHMYIKIPEMMLGKNV